MEQRSDIKNVSDDEMSTFIGASKRYEKSRAIPCAALPNGLICDVGLRPSRLP